MGEEFFCHFAAGRQISHLEDVDPNYEKIKNQQDNGYGVRGAIRFIKQFREMDVYFEPYCNYWHIYDSEIANVVYSNVIVGYGQEPDNNFTEYGFKMGISF